MIIAHLHCETDVAAECPEIIKMSKKKRRRAEFWSDKKESKTSSFCFFFLLYEATSLYRQSFEVVPGYFEGQRGTLGNTNCRYIQSRNTVESPPIRGA